MSHLAEALGALSRLLSYPDDHTVQATELLFVVLQGEVPEAARAASKFGDFVQQHELWEVEETFTRAFDVNPACALEVGWHLFGEEYARGMFLVRMREELRRYGLPESAELPDHISHVLSVVAAMPADKSSWFVRACVSPAVQKMNDAMADKDSPYRHVVACLDAVLKHIWGSPPEATSEAPLGGSQQDPLHAFPVADVPSGCPSSCSEQVDLVPLQVNLSMPREPSNPPTSAPARKP